MTTLEDVLRLQREQRVRQLKNAAQIAGFWAAYGTYVFVLGYFWLKRIGAL